MVPQEGNSSTLDKDNFEQGLGKGIAKVFKDQDKVDQDRILEEANKNGNFGFSFSENLGAIFASLKDSATKIKIFEIASTNDSFANNLFAEMDAFNDVINITQSDVVEKAFDIAKKNKNVADKLGSIFGFSLGDLNGRVDTRNIDLILSKLDDNNDFASSFGSSVGQVFQSISSIEVKNRILEIAMKNDMFGNHFFSMLTLSFNSLDKSIRDQVSNASRNNDKLALRLGEIIGQSYSTLAGRIRNR